MNNVFLAYLFNIYVLIFIFKMYTVYMVQCICSETWGLCGL